MLLPPTATLTVTLEDGAKMDVAAVKVAEATVPIDGAPPYRVTLSHQPSELDPRGRYGVRARIENEGQLMFISTRFNPAFGTDGSADSPAHDPVSVMVSRVAAGRNAKGSSITGTRWFFKTLYGEDAGTGAGGDAAHIGGAIAGWFFIRNAHLLRDFFDVFGDSRRGRRRTRGSGPSQREVDRIFDKIRDKGMESLSEKEKQILARASEAKRRGG